MASRPRTLRQRWSDAFKKRIVAEASQPGETVAQIARRLDLDGRRVSNWMKKFGSRTALILIDITSDADGLSAPPCIEIVVPCGTRVRCGSETNMELVTGIIAAPIIS